MKPHELARAINDAEKYPLALRIAMRLYLDHVSEEEASRMLLTQPDEEMRLLPEPLRHTVFINLKDIYGGFRDHDRNPRLGYLAANLVTDDGRVSVKDEFGAR
jgi:hypothetical protein